MGVGWVMLTLTLSCFRGTVLNQRKSEHTGLCLVLSEAPWKLTQGAPPLPAAPAPTLTPAPAPLPSLPPPPTLCGLGQTWGVGGVAR